MHVCLCVYFQIIIIIILIRKLSIAEDVKVTQITPSAFVTFWPLWFPGSMESHAIFVPNCFHCLCFPCLMLKALSSLAISFSLGSPFPFLPCVTRIKWLANSSKFLKNLVTHDGQYHPLLTCYSDDIRISLI